MSLEGFPTFPTGLFAASTLKPEASEFIVFGVPFYGRSSGRRAAFSGPDAIRNASVELETLSLRFRLDYDDIKIADVGNIIGMDFKRVFSNVRETVKRILEINVKPVMLGGEHTFTWAAVREIRPTHIFLFDAHLDLRDHYLGEKLSHTTFLRRMCEELPDLRVIHVGFRGGVPEELKYAKEREVKLIPSPIHPGKSISVGTLKNHVDEAESIYISVDLDVIDPAYMVEVGNPEPEGMAPSALFDLFTAFTGKKVKGFDVMELSPTLNWSPSHHLAAKVVFELMSATSSDTEIRAGWDQFP
ncbi:MAG: agmatinase [Candidatus Geothermarchaeales archaeon]